MFQYFMRYQRRENKFVQSTKAQTFISIFHFIVIFMSYFSQILSPHSGPLCYPNNKRTIRRCLSFPQTTYFVFPFYKPYIYIVSANHITFLLIFSHIDIYNIKNRTWLSRHNQKAKRIQSEYIIWNKPDKKVKSMSSRLCSECEAFASDSLQSLEDLFPMLVNNSLFV